MEGTIKMDILANMKEVQELVAAACKRSNRDPKEVTILIKEARTFTPQKTFKHSMMPDGVVLVKLCSRIT